MLLCSVQIFINYLGRTKRNDGLKYFQLMSAPLVLYLMKSKCLVLYTFWNLLHLKFLPHCFRYHLLQVNISYKFQSLVKPRFKVFRYLVGILEILNCVATLKIYKEEEIPVRTSTWLFWAKMEAQGFNHS